MAVGGFFRFLKTERFHQIFSFLVGFGLIALFKPMCKGDDCTTKKAPSVEEIEKTTYQIGSKCYRFKSGPIECRSEGVVEPFWAASAAPAASAAKRSKQ